MSIRKKKAATEKKRLEDEMEDIKQSAEVRALSCAMFYFFSSFSIFFVVLLHVVYFPQ